MYLKYDDFLALGGDGTIDEVAYTAHEMRARRMLDALTHGRLKGESPVRECVRFCMSDLINARIADEKAAGVATRDIASVSNDGVSVTYAAAQAEAGAIPAGYARIIRLWMGGETTANGVALLYAGVD